jgi:hypothetical protein
MYPNFEFCPPDSSRAPPILKSKHVPTSVLRTSKIRHRLQNFPLHGGAAPHRAPPSVRTFTSAANIQQTQVPSDLVVCRQHTQPTTTPPLNFTTNLPTSTPNNKPSSVTMSSTSNLPPTYKQMLLRDLPAHALAADQYNPGRRLAGHPLAPFLNVTKPPPAEHDMGTALAPSHGQ